MGLKMQKHLKIFMTGALFVIPLAATIYIIFFVGEKLGDFGQNILTATNIMQVLPGDDRSAWETPARWIGVFLVIAIIYVIGLLANSIFFRKIFSLIDYAICSLPGIKTIYESIRDLLKLFGQGAERRQGKSVLYRPAGADTCMLGILTNDEPLPQPNGEKRYAVFLPMAYMIGGPVVLAKPEEVTLLDMPVERALKLAVTAFIVTDKPDEETNVAKLFKRHKKKIEMQVDITETETDSE